MNQKILIVEDEKNLGTTLSEFLNSKGYACHLATTAASAREYFNHHPDIYVVLMDIGLPDDSGLNLAKEFRYRRKNFVLLFLSALNDPQTRLEGLEVGAQDYITKPFVLKELILRLDRILKNHQLLESLPEHIQHGNLDIWFRRYEVKDALGNMISLTQKECAVLELLYQHKNQVLTREKIIDEIWGEDQFPSHRTVDNYIVKLRKWSATDASGSLEIQSIRGAGYKLVIK